MENPLFVALVAGSVAAGVAGIITVSGWWVVHFLSKRREQQAHVLTKQREEEAHYRQAQLRHVQQQIGELYGPLYGLIDQITKTWKMTIEAGIGKDTELAIYFYDKFFGPLHEQVISLMQSKHYLAIDGDRPPSFDEYLDHAVYQKSYHGLLGIDGCKAKNIKERNWSRQFHDDVANALNMLIEENARLQGPVEAENYTAAS